MAVKVTKQCIRSSKCQGANVREEQFRLGSEKLSIELGINEDEMRPDS